MSRSRSVKFVSPTNLTDTSCIHLIVSITLPHNIHRPPDLQASIQLIMARICGQQDTQRYVTTHDQLHRTTTSSVRKFRVGVVGVLTSVWKEFCVRQIHKSIVDRSLRDITAKVAAACCRVAEQEGVATVEAPAEGWERHLRDEMWWPEYEEYV